MHDMFSTKICHAVFYTRPKYLTARWEGKKMDAGKKYNLGMFQILQFWRLKPFVTYAGFL